MVLQERRRSVDGAELRILDSGGDGPAVVILHGLAGSGDEFRATAAELPEFRVVLLDQRGHGGSTRRPADASRAGFVDDVIQVLESLAAPVALVGQSMGAHTAMLVAAARPDLVERLVLLEGGPGGEDPAGNARTADWFRSWPLPFHDTASAHRFLGDGPLARTWIESLEHDGTGLRPPFDVEIMARVIETMNVARWTEWEQVAASALVIYAEHGIFTEEQRREFVRRGRAVRRVDLKNASHDAHLDSFNTWVEALRDFLTDARLPS